MHKIFEFVVNSEIRRDRFNQTSQKKLQRKGQRMESASSLTIEFVTLQKRLNAAWSSGSVSRTLTAALLDDVYTNFAKMEKKIKMRIMLSLLGLDANKKQELSKSIKRLLKLASSDDKSSEMWVAVTAGLVYERLFGLSTDDMEGVCDSAKSMLSETTETTLQHLIDLARMESTASDSTFYFQPLEFCFLSSSLTSKIDAESTENGHFLYCGTTPNLLAREKERQKNDQRDKAPMNAGLMRVKNDSSQQSSNSSSSSSSSSSSAGRGNIASLAARRTSIVASQGTYRGPAKMISIDEIKIKEAAKEAAKKESEAPTLPPPQETEEDKGKQGKEKEHKEKKRKAPKEETQKVEKKPKIATTMVGGAGAGAVAEEKSSLVEANKEPDLVALFAESPSLSEEDKKTLTAYFSEEWTTYFADAIAKNEKTRRLLLKEEVTASGKAFYYFHLIFEGHTWKKTKKSKSV